jgi:N-acetylglucosamine kinase-like BadF-type ATPase
MSTLKIIADGGSTKTDWYIGSDAVHGQRIQTKGMNPFFTTDKEMAKRFKHLPATPVDEIHFYGAGCTPEIAPKVKAALQEQYPGALIHVESDMLGAARAVCRHQPGIACILGTGSNSCQYDGERILRQVPTLGYVLGDYGGGDTLGKTLLSRVYKRRLPQEVLDAFEADYHLTQAEALQHVYKEPNPNRYLASFVPFLARHRHVPEVHKLLVESFRQLLHSDVLQYDVQHLRVGFVGSVAYHFQEELREAVKREGIHQGIVSQSPMEGLIDYHF